MVKASGRLACRDLEETTGQTYETSSGHALTVDEIYGVWLEPVEISGSSILFAEARCVTLRRR